MSFFDSKQEVIKLELTPYGRSLLSKGKFSPKYYSFHDDDIIYDVLYASASAELQSSASARILDQTLYSKPQARIKSVNSTILNSKEKDDLTDNNFILTALGNSSVNSDYKPAWDVRILKGEINSFSSSYNKTNLNTVEIPQINLKDVMYSLVVKTANEEKSSLDFIFPDNTAITVERGFLLIDLKEKNVDDELENFEFEIFEVQSTGSKEFLNKIEFPVQPKIINNNILLDEPEVIITDAERDRINLVLADNYFSILVDQEIDLESLLGEKAKQVTATTREIITKPPFGEDC